MDKKDITRKRAEELHRSPPNEILSSGEDFAKIIHELRVHQIELEMQNDELRRSKSKLATEKEAYFNMYNLAPLGFLTLSETGLVTEVNLVTLKLLGLSHDQVISKAFTKFIWSEDQDNYYFFKRKMSQDDKTDSIELRLMKQDGAPFFAELETRIVKNWEGNNELRMTISDISDRRVVEDALKIRESQLTAIIENQPGAVWLKNLDGKFLVVNTLFAHSLGKDSPADIIGLTDQELFRKDISAKNTERDRIVIKEKKQIRSEESDFENDKISWYQTFVGPIFNKLNQVIGTTGHRFLEVRDR